MTPSERRPGNEGERIQRALFVVSPIGYIADAMGISTSDWKTFRRCAPEWRERYLRRKNQELVAVLGDETLTPTERFWRAEERMAEEARVLRACLDGHSKRKVAWYLSLMYGHGMIGDDDLGEFSEGLREAVRASLGPPLGEESSER